jgi:hypothetical protein
MRALRTILGLLILCSTLAGCIVYSDGPSYPPPYRGYYSYGYSGPGYYRPYHCYRCW